MEEKKPATAVAPAAKNGRPETPKGLIVKPGEPQKNEGPDLAPLEDRLHRLNQLFDLQNKYNRLNESLTKLQQFALNANGDTITLELEDDKRNRFTTAHPSVVAEVIETLKARTKDKIKEIEPLLKW